MNDIEKNQSNSVNQKVTIFVFALIHPFFFMFLINLVAQSLGLNIDWATGTIGLIGVYSGFEILTIMNPEKKLGDPMFTKLSHLAVFFVFVLIALLIDFSRSERVDSMWSSVFFIMAFSFMYLPMLSASC